jgi:hypothetical protein
MSDDEAEAYLTILEAQRRENREAATAARKAGDAVTLAVCAENFVFLRREIKFAKADLKGR